MAGSEKTGYLYSRAELCKGAIYPITPTGENKPDDIEKYRTIIQGIGFKPIVMSPEEHDRTAAAISHIPHLAAAELTLLVRDNENQNKHMQLLASTGFRDTTRIAASSADVWQQICMSNADNISELLEQYIEKLTELKDAIDTRNYAYIEKLFTDSKLYRSLFD